MPLDNVMFNVENGTYVIENVRISGEGKLIGINDFKLGKLPIVYIYEKSRVREVMKCNLEYIVNMMNNMSTEVVYTQESKGFVYSYVAEFECSEYKDREDLLSILSNYKKMLKFEGIDKIDGEIIDNKVKIKISKDLRIGGV